MSMMSMNVSVEVALGGGNNARFVMATRKLLQHQVKHHTVIRAKWLDLIRGVQAGGKTYKVMLQAEGVSATTSKSSAPNQRISVFKVAASSAPTPDQSNQKWQTLPSEEIPPGAIKLNSTNQCVQDESYQEAKKLLTVQQSNGEELFIKVPGFFRELPLDAVALARLLIFFSIPFSIQNILKENPPEEAFPEMILIMVFVLVLLQQMEGTNHLAPNVLRDGMQTITNTQFLLFCSIGLMSLSGTHAGDSTENIDQSGSAVDGNVWEKGDYFKAAALPLASMIIGVAGAWWMLKRPATPEFAVDQGLMRSPIPRKSNPICVIHPPLAYGLYP